MVGASPIMNGRAAEVLSTMPKAASARVRRVRPVTRRLACNGFCSPDQAAAAWQK